MHRQLHPEGDDERINNAKTCMFDDRNTEIENAIPLAFYEERMIYSSSALKEKLLNVLFAIKVIKCQ